MSIPTLNDIQAARARIAGHVHVTPMVTSRTLADRSGVASFSIKAESMQKTGSFKVRGALNAVSQLDDAARARGVVTVSAGNHAQALAWASQSVGVKCTVVMPVTASEAKAAASAGYGATVIRHGVSHEAFAHAMKLAEEKQLTFIHPFDDMRIASGAATAGLEIMEQCPHAEIVVVPIGGGGLIGGIASAIKQMHPHVRIIGVEPEGAAVMRQSIDAGHPVKMPNLNTIADGLAAPFAGEIPFEIVSKFVDDVVLVTDNEIFAAMSLLLTRCKLLAEPAGAAATAALLAKKISDQAGKHVVAVLSGGNVDLAKLPRE